MQLPSACPFFRARVSTRGSYAPLQPLVVTVSASAFRDDEPTTRKQRSRAGADVCVHRGRFGQPVLSTSHTPARRSSLADAFFRNFSRRSEEEFAVCASVLDRCLRNFRSVLSIAIDRCIDSSTQRQRTQATKNVRSPKPRCIDFLPQTQSRSLRIFGCCFDKRRDGGQLLATGLTSFLAGWAGQAVCEDRRHQRNPGELLSRCNLALLHIVAPAATTAP